ncbi:MAG: hypothetical protein GY946_11490, partial [bacterium]|nr:hypothetical protein [bacterium]
GGALGNGTYTSDGIGVLEIGDNGSNLLYGMTIEGDVTLSAPEALFQVNDGLTLNGTIRMVSLSSIGFIGDETIDGMGTIWFDPSTTHAKYLEQAVSGTLTIGSGITVEGAHGRIGSVRHWNNMCSVINEGTISANNAAGEIYVETRNGGSLTTTPTSRLEAVNGGELRIRNLEDNLGVAIVNTGGRLVIEGGAYTVDQAIALADPNTSLTLGGTYTIEQPLTQSGPGTSLVLGGTWSTMETLTVSDGELELGGTFGLADFGKIVRTGGSASITGTLDLAGGTLALTEDTGSWLLDGGALGNGTYTSDEIGVLEISDESSNLLYAMTIEGDVTLSASEARFRVNEGLTLNGTIRMESLSSIGFIGDETIDGDGTVIFDPSTTHAKYLEQAAASGTLTIGSGITVEGAHGRIGGARHWNNMCSVINEGTISANDAAG